MTSQLSAALRGCRAAPVNISLDDAMELGHLLHLLDDWLATDHDPACLAWALDHGIASGVWGGTTEDERRVLRRPAERK